MTASLGDKLADPQQIIADLRRNLDEATAQQVATAKILKVIASSRSDVRPVFEAIVDSAARLFEPCGATIITLKDGQLQWNATAATLPAFDIQRAKAIYPIPFDPERAPSARAVLERRIIEIPDIAAPDTPEFTRKAAVAGGFQSATFVPLIKQDKGIGTIILTHLRAGFKLSEKQLALVATFADQAVIAIENTRLFNETREALERQTATADILKVIASSPGDLRPVFNAMLENATRICEAQYGVMFKFSGGAFHVDALLGVPPAFAENLLRGPRLPRPGTALGRLSTTKEIVHIPDVRAERAYIDGDPQRRATADLGGARTFVAVPMLKDNELVGALTVYRQEVRLFSEKQIELVTSFADQAVVAIENVRLVNELRERTRELSQSLDDLRTAQDRLVQTEKLASLGQLTAGIAHEIKNPLNFVNNFSALSAELVAEMSDVLAKTSLDVATREELDELAQMLKSNLEKVVQHGKRADSIVKNMLQHSREGSSEHRPADINTIVDESLNLAYHGARAEKAGFSIAFQRDLDPSVGMVDVYPQEITRVLLNIISNGFYAATKRKAEAGEGFEPTLAAVTKNLGDKVEIRIRDNGTGIPDEVKAKIFNPFFTTKPSGEGTGLGLSMSHDIIVKQHGGSIDVDTEPGLFTEFKIVLPRTSQR
jgi:two-component system, NtrC family, sensor kinase